MGNSTKSNKIIAGDTNDILEESLNKFEFCNNLIDENSNSNNNGNNNKDDRNEKWYNLRSSKEKLVENLFGGIHSIRPGRGKEAHEEEKMTNVQEEEKMTNVQEEEEKMTNVQEEKEAYNNKNKVKEKSKFSEKKQKKQNYKCMILLDIVFYVLKSVYILFPIILSVFILYIPHVHKRLPDEWFLKHMLSKYVLPAYDYEYYASSSILAAMPPISSFSLNSESSHDFADTNLIYNNDLLEEESEENKKETYKKMVENIKEGNVPRPQSLVSHNIEFNKEIIEVVDNVYVAVGYGLANNVIILGENNECIVIDTMESKKSMENVWNDFLKLIKEKKSNTNELVVKAIIYTHFHTDHILGASAIYTPNVTEVYAHIKTQVEIDKVFTLVGGLTYIRSMRQFGVFVDEKNFVNAGIGKSLFFNSDTDFGSIYPTNIISGDHLNVTLANVDLELIYAPGESSDHIVVWYKEKEVLMGADNIYKAFPNIYAIRGTEARDCNLWIDSLNKMRKLKPKYLVLGHTRPIYGYENIQQIILAYRDAIQFVHDQTIRYMNKGYTANEIVEKVKLPVNLKTHPYLQEHYGKIAWAIRAIFNRYVGWFSGDAQDLNPLTRKQKSYALAELAGGFDNLIEKAQKSFENGNFQWALELSSAAYNINLQSKNAKQLKILSLKGMAALQKSACGRNWYLTEALELENDIVLKIGKQQKRKILGKLNIKDIFKFLPVRLDASKFSVGNVISFHFEDTGENICIHYRNGVAFNTWPCEEKPENQIRTTESTWIAILNGDLSPAIAYGTGKIKLEGSITKLLQTFSLTELD